MWNTDNNSHWERNTQIGSFPLEMWEYTEEDNILAIGQDMKNILIQNSPTQEISEYEGDGVDYDSWQSIPQANQAQFMQQAKQVGMTPQELYNQMRDEEKQDDAHMGGPTTAMVDEHHLQSRQQKEEYLTNFLDVAVEGFFDELSDEELEQLYQYTEENGDLPPDYRGDAESGFLESVRQKIGEWDDDDEDDPDAGHTVNGKPLSPEEYRKWKEEEGEYDDMDKENRPRW